MCKNDNADMNSNNQSPTNSPAPDPGLMNAILNALDELNELVDQLNAEQVTVYATTTLTLVERGSKLSRQVLQHGTPEID